MKRFIDSFVFPGTWLFGFGGGGFSQWLYAHGHPAWWVVMIVCGLMHLAAMLWVLTRLQSAS